MTNRLKLPLYTKSLVIITVLTIIISSLLTIYEVELPVKSARNWLVRRISKFGVVKNFKTYLKNTLGVELKVSQLKGGSETTKAKQNHSKKDLVILTPDQLALFDGSRTSKPVYLSLLGRVYNVEKGRKHYAPGGGYNFFAGKDATRAFVTGDFTADGLTDDVECLTESEILSINDWISFYDKEYEFIGFLEGTYYDANGKQTQRLKEVNEKISRAKLWKEKQLLESEVFPPCNSEWQKEIGGRVWCTNKSGGIKRDWVGVPRKLFSPGDKRNSRCACVKNFGNPIATPGKIGNRGDLENANLREYEDCPFTSISCKLPAH